MKFHVMPPVQFFFHQYPVFDLLLGKRIQTCYLLSSQFRQFEPLQVQIAAENVLS